MTFFTKWRRANVHASYVLRHSSHVRLRPDNPLNRTSRHVAPRGCRSSTTVSHILANSQLSGGTEALLGFWGEPFMARSTGRDVPRVISHVHSNAEILPHLVELQRGLANSRHE